MYIYEKRLCEFLEYSNDNLQVKPESAGLFLCEHHGPMWIVSSVSVAHTHDCCCYTALDPETSYACVCVRKLASGKKLGVMIIVDR